MTSKLTSNEMRFRFDSFYEDDVRSTKSCWDFTINEHSAPWHVINQIAHLIEQTEEDIITKLYFTSQWVRFTNEIYGGVSLTVTDITVDNFRDKLLEIFDWLKKEFNDE